MGLPAYSGPITFADDWRRAIESNGCVVETIAANAIAANESTYAIRFGDLFLNCIGWTSKKVQTHPESIRDLYTLILVLHNSRDDGRTLLLDVHHILAASGAETSNTIDGGYVLFKGNCAKSELLEAYRAVLSTRGFALHLSEVRQSEAVSQGNVCSQSNHGQKIAEVLVGRSVDLATREPCAFLAIRPLGVLSRAIGTFSGESYSTLLDLCTDVPSLAQMQQAGD